jgi:hypothetical protein
MARPSLNGRGIHPKELPVMSVEVVDARYVHEAVVLGGHGLPSAGGQRLLDELVDFGAAAARDAKRPSDDLLVSQISRFVKVLKNGCASSMTNASSLTIMHAAF